MKNENNYLDVYSFSSIRYSMHLAFIQDLTNAYEIVMNLLAFNSLFYMRLKIFGPNNAQS
jgi:hypothetical protein